MEQWSTGARGTGDYLTKNTKSALTTISVLHLRTQLRQVIHQSVTQNQHFLVEKNGLPTVVIVPLRDYEAFLKKRSK